MVSRDQFLTPSNHCLVRTIPYCLNVNHIHLVYIILLIFKIYRYRIERENKHPSLDLIGKFLDSYSLFSCWYISATTSSISSRKSASPFSGFHPRASLPWSALILALCSSALIPQATQTSESQNAVDILRPHNTLRIPLTTVPKLLFCILQCHRAYFSAFKGTNFLPYLAYLLSYRFPRLRAVRREIIPLLSTRS
jgi:hypothetical protein